MKADFIQDVVIRRKRPSIELDSIPNSTWPGWGIIAKEHKEWSVGGKVLRENICCKWGEAEFLLN